jgi:hypothetical protein
MDFYPEPYKWKLLPVSLQLILILSYHLLLGVKDFFFNFGLIVQICHFNGNINRKVSQTQLQYYINYTMGACYMFRPLRGHLQAIR